MEYIFKVKIKVSGNVTQDEVQDYLEFIVGETADIDPENPFINQDNDAQISVVYVMLD
jgi:hypothetical protein